MKTKEDVLETYIDYINSQLPDKPGDKILYKYKKKILDEMTLRANEVTSRGLGDSDVVDDLIISEYPDLEKEYKAYHKKETAAMNRKRNIIYNLVGSAIYLLTLVTVYLGVSFATHNWGMTWAIVVDGVLIWVVYLLSFGVRKFASMKKIFHIFARILLAGSVMIMGVAAFLLVIAITDIPRSWLILIITLIGMFVTDGAFCSLNKHRLAIFYWLLYIPVISVFLFVIIGAAGLMAWNVAWIIIPLSLIIDAVIILMAIAKNKVEKLEVDDEWNED